MPIVMVVIWFVAALSGALVSFVFAVSYVSFSGSWVPVVFAGAGIAVWVYALCAPLALPVYKGILPALFPMIGLLYFGLLGFGAGWLAVAVCHSIADARRFAALSEKTAVGRHGFEN